MIDGYQKVLLKLQNNGKVLKKHSSPKLTFSGNFTDSHRLFDIQPHYGASGDNRLSLRKKILNEVMIRTKAAMEAGNRPDDNPTYEDPRDVIAVKPQKPPRKCNVHAIAVTSSPQEREIKGSLKEVKRKLAKKYENLIMTLMERCEESVVQISDKDCASIQKLKDKLKTVLEYNTLFAEENDQLKQQKQALVKYIEECKKVLKEEIDKSRDVELRCRELEDKVKQYNVPDREHQEINTAIPLVEVCMSCSSRQIILNQMKEHNSRLQKDMQALKDVLYRLNVQLSRYQEKLRNNLQPLCADGKETIHKCGENYGGLDSLITASLEHKGQENVEDAQSHKTEDGKHIGRMVDLSGLLSAQALAPLFDAYQENLQEKDSLILDYEKQFENMNKKTKEIVIENKSLLERVNNLETELGHVRQSYKKLLVEKETADIEKITLLERAERAEKKLKEVYELYEDKMAAMMRDYETVHREYFSVKNALEAREGKLATMEMVQSRTVPADLHEHTVLQCNRLLEELKHQYSMDTERRNQMTATLKQQLRSIEEKYDKVCQERDVLKEELQAAVKNAKLYRKAAVVFRQRLKDASARIVRVRRGAQKARNNSEPMKLAMDTLHRIKSEIKTVKSKAHLSLEELERRIVEQERKAAMAQAEYRREIERASVALEHKEAIIRSLIDKVADIEEVRLSQSNTHRLQGIDSDNEPLGEQTQRAPFGRPEASGSQTRFVPEGGGYYQEREDKRKGM